MFNKELINHINFLESEVRELYDKYWKLQDDIRQLNKGLNAAGFYLTEPKQAEWIKREE